MAIRPTDIRRKEFKSGFRGYDANEVDDFLDEVADEYERTFADNKRLTDEMASLKDRLQQFEDLEGAIREALVQAQQVARDLRQNAGKEAELIIREAKEQSHRILADSSSRVERVQESYEVLRKAKQDFANDFRHLLKSYISVMDNVDVTSAKEIEASLRERLDTESIAVAHEAAETRKMDHDDATREYGGTQDDGQGTEETWRVETASTEQAGVTEEKRRVETAAAPVAGTTGNERGPQPEVEEPEVDPSSVESAPQNASAPAPQTSGEVEREQPTTQNVPAPAARTSGEQNREDEEPVPAGRSQGRTADEFFGQGGGRDDAEERKIFRASRFLRRRG
ncbi:hypothetical protein BH24ACT19_BH24ACT19_09640 [soil metagenome]